MGGCQNYGRFLGTLNIRCRIIIGLQRGVIILTTTHIGFGGSGLMGLGFGSFGFHEGFEAEGIGAYRLPCRGLGLYILWRRFAPKNDPD